jgi:hypothetical protein
MRPDLSSVVGGIMYPQKFEQLRSVWRELIPGGILERIKKARVAYGVRK